MVLHPVHRPFTADRAPRFDATLPFRLLDIVHADQKLYLVFEFLDVDLKRYMENGNKSGNPLSLEIVKVCLFEPQPHLVNSLLPFPLLTFLCMFDACTRKMSRLDAYLVMSLFFSEIITLCVT